MSELEDKPEPSRKAADAKHGAASPEAEAAKSQIDSDWDMLLGSATSSASNRPIFAPPGAGKRAASGPVPDGVPRTSGSGASVSGEFMVAEPRPEPATPPRYEPPDGVTVEDELVPGELVRAEHATEDDDRETPNDPPLVLSIASPANDPEPAVAEPPATPERPRARPPEAAEPDPEPNPESSGGGSRNLLFILGAIAAVVAVVVLISNDRDIEPTASTKPDKAPIEQPSKPTIEQPEPIPSEATPGTETGGGETGGGETGGGETGGEVEPRPAPSNVNPRDPSVIPPGTPDENAKAFVKLPVSIHDGPPVGGIGRSGIHIDAISTARGRDNTDCSEPTRSFSAGVAEYVNVCFRVVHPREQESLRVIWEKDGKVTRRGRVRIPDLHAYTTRAYLLVRPEYVGRWRVRIVPEGEETIDLAVAEFEITE